MAKQPTTYRALLIRADTRSMIDQIKKAHYAKTGLHLNYSQFLTLMCQTMAEKLNVDMKFGEGDGG